MYVTLLCSGLAIDACGVCGGINLCKLNAVTVTLGSRRSIDSNYTDSLLATAPLRDQGQISMGFGWSSVQSTGTAQLSASHNSLWHCTTLALIAVGWALIASTKE